MLELPEIWQQYQIASKFWVTEEFDIEKYLESAFLRFEIEDHFHGHTK